MRFLSLSPLTCIHAQLEHLFRHFKRSNVIRFNFAVQDRVQLHQYLHLNQVSQAYTNFGTGFGKLDRAIKVSACEPIKIVTRLDGIVHSRRNLNCY